MTTLFNQKTIQRLCKDTLITTTHKKYVKEWLNLLEQNALRKEEENYDIFSEIILENILGYSRRDIKRECDNVEFSYRNSENEKILCIEAKGTDTKDLTAPQHRKKIEHSTPIKQIWDYMGHGYEYGICTNYRHFIMLVKKFGHKQYHFFNFNAIQKENGDLDEKKLKEFIGIFSKKSIIADTTIEKLKNESLIEEKEFTKEFYKLFHETRLMMIKEFQFNGMTKPISIHITQILLNRLIFIFFAEDMNLIFDRRLFYNRILKLVDSGTITDTSKKISDDLDDLFTAFDKGSSQPSIFGFNGGLFSGKLPPNAYFQDVRKKDFFNDVRQNFNLSKFITLDDHATNIVNKIKNLNPIIENILIMDSFDFSTEVNVEILGHIFEQSISDIEELLGKKSSKRKKDGVYYTSEYITDYICKNTIIPYLSKSGKINDPDKLVEEYDDDIEILEKKFRNIKIIDPACGSGAFLIKSIDVLLDIYKSIQSHKQSKGDYITDEQFQLTKWNEESKIQEIIEKNIYGVDINKQSIEIAKLSIFLKTASINMKLPNITENIKIGNSLINDKKIDVHAFDWEKEFPEVLNTSSVKGFDIVIGNPPWQIIKSDVDEFFSPLYDSSNQKNKFSKLSKLEKNSFVKKCLGDNKINLMYEDYKSNYKNQVNFFGQSNNYEYQTSESNNKRSSSDMNLYKLFVEKSYKLLKPNGKCGLVVPSGIYSDLGSKGLRNLIINKNTLQHLFAFINKQGIFADVHRQFKFCTIIFSKGGMTEKFLASFYMEDVTQLEYHEKIAYDYDVKLIQMASPDSLSLLECKNKNEFQILQKLYKYPILYSDEWNFSAKREFDMTNDSNLFHTTNIGHKLYEGKMINQFTHIFAEPRYWIDVDEGNNTLFKKEKNRMKKINKKYQADPQIDSNEYRLVWRSITNSTNERTFITTILPPRVFLGNSLNYLSPIKFDGTKYVRPITYEETIFLCGIFNSFPLDYILRHKVATNLNIFYLMELPVPRYDKNNKLHTKLFQNVARMICTTNEYDTLKKIIKISDPIIDAEQRLGFQAQINALSAKIYDLQKKDLEFILKNFPIVDEKLKKETLNEFELLNA